MPEVDFNGKIMKRKISDYPEMPNCVPPKEEFEMPNHNKLIYDYVKSLLKDVRTKSVYYETLEGDESIEHIQKLEIITNKKIIKAEY